MSGHSKWSTIKHKKGAADAKRAKLFTRLNKEITVAAKIGGGIIENNPRLRKAVDTAKSNNMPQDNITRAIQKGTGELPGVDYEEVVYEGYGPEGTAIYIESMTDNKNRTVAEMRHLLGKNGGNLGENGCVAWMFERKGVITIEATEEVSVDEEDLFMAATEAGAEDIQGGKGAFEVITAPDDFDAVNDALKAAGFPIASADVQMVPTNTVEIDDEAKAKKVLKLMDALEDHDDIQKVTSNFDIPEAILEGME